MAASALSRGLRSGLPTASTTRPRRHSGAAARAVPARRNVIMRADLKEKTETPPATTTTTSTPTSTPSIEGSVDMDQLLKDLQEKWDGIENKSTVLIYGGASVVALWTAGTILSAVDSIPLLPKVLELVGLVYSAWFVYRYLLFKSSREELITDVEELKKKISGTE